MEKNIRRNLLDIWPVSLHLAIENMVFNYITFLTLKTDILSICYKHIKHLCEGILGMCISLKA